MKTPVIKRRNSSYLPTADGPPRILDFFQVKKRAEEQCPVSAKRRRLSIEIRRPVRKATSETFTLTAEKPSSNGFGIFATYPEEVLDEVMHKMPFKSIAMLSLCSSSLMNYTKRYYFSKRFEKRLRDETEQKDGKGFSGLGLLIYVLTSLTLSEEQRIIFFKEQCKRFYSVIPFLEYFFIIQHEFMTCMKRTSADYQKILDVLLSLDDSLESDLLSILNNEPASTEVEGKTRKRLNNLLFAHHGGHIMCNRNTFWLSALLKRFKTNTQQQSKILYILFAPTAIGTDEHTEYIEWDAFTRRPVQDKSDAEEMMMDMSQALAALMGTRGLRDGHAWSKNAIFNLIEEVTTFPEPWSMNNFVSILILQPSLMPISIVSRMNRKDYNQETAEMICTMCSMVSRWDQSVSLFFQSPLQIIAAALNEEQRRLLVAGVHSLHISNVETLRQDYENYEDMINELDSHAALLPLLYSCMA